MKETLPSAGLEAGVPGAEASPATLKLDRLPFEGSLSLLPLVEAWRAGAPQDRLSSYVVDVIEEELQQQPELAAGITDLKILANRQDFLSLLFSGIAPAVTADRSVMAATVPFSNTAFFATPLFRRFLLDEHDSIVARTQLDAQTFAYARTLSVYLHLLRTLYDTDLAFDYPIVISSEATETGLERFFKLEFDYRFLHVEAKPDRGELTRESRMRLLANISDLSVFYELLPPDSFSFYGFEVVHAVDVTDREVISKLKEDLLTSEFSGSVRLFSLLNDRVRTFLRKPEIGFMLVAIEGNTARRLYTPPDTLQTGPFSTTGEYLLTDLDENLFTRAVETSEIQVIEDLILYPGSSGIEKSMLEAGARAVLAAPLLYHKVPIGLLVLWSARSGDLTTLDTIRIREVLPLCATVVRRAMEELHRRVQASILENYTSIHPSVEWRFRKAARRYILRRDAGEPAEIEPIRFEDVYPLFGVTDIKGSSDARNEAVREDLLEHLELVDSVLREAHRVKPIPILEQLMMSARLFRRSLRGGLSSGDEASVHDFIGERFEPLLDHLSSFSPDTEAIVNRYRNRASEKQGGLKTRRQAYDESVTILNNTISAFLDAEERKAQRHFPHYFEKHLTDGVEYSIYAGASLLENGMFDPLYVRNLRLWQLMVMCGIERRLSALQNYLPIPLEATHLVLVHTAPISISFQLAESRFDVDGTFHVRYEIMKRRVDKALLKDREERLTQAGKIAIVYAQPREGIEYEEYLHFLSESGYIEPDIERVEVADLQGMTGLKAFRVIPTKGGSRPDEISHEVIAEAIARLPFERS